MSTVVRRRGPGSRADERHPTRHELLEAADAIAERDGLAALSVAEITSEAGLGKGTFYIHFPDRAALLVQLHRRFGDQSHPFLGWDRPNQQKIRQLHHRSRCGVHDWSLGADCRLATS